MLTPPDNSEYDNRKCYDIGGAINNHIDSLALGTTVVFNIDNMNITQSARTHSDQFGMSKPISSHQLKANER